MGAGDAIAVLCGNRHEWVEAVMASGIGAYILVPLNWHLTADELAYILNDSGAKALLAETEYAGVGAEALKECPAVTVRLVIGGDGPEGFEGYDDLLAGASPDEPANQVAGTYMFYTSGTTGRPKGVRTSSFVVGMPVSVHAAMLSGLAGMFHIPDGGVCLINVPLPRWPVPVLHAAGLPGCHPPHAPPVGSRGDAPPRRRVRGHVGLCRAHALRPAPPPPRRGASGVRRLEPEGRLPYRSPLCPRGEAADDRVVGTVIDELYSATEAGGLGCFVTETNGSPSRARSASPAGHGRRDRPGEEDELRRRRRGRQSTCAT